MRVVHHGRHALGEALVVLADDRVDPVDRSEVAAHREDAVEDHDHPVDPVGDRLQTLLEMIRVVVAEDRPPLARHVGDAHRADDAVVVELVADPVRPLVRQRQADAQCRRVGRVEDPRGGPADVAGDHLLQLVVRPERAVDEPHGAGSGAETMRRGIGGRDHVRVSRQREIAVGIHAQEFELAAGQLVAWPALALRRDVVGDDAFRGLGTALLYEGGDLGAQHGVETI